MPSFPSPLFGKSGGPAAPPPGGGAGLDSLIALFGGQPGLLIDPDDMTTMWKNIAGTVPAVVGDLVRRINDKSGNANHLIAPSDASSPILRQVNGFRFLEFDGTGHQMPAAFAVAQSWDRISALRQISYVPNAYVYGDISGNAGVLYSTGASPNLALYDGGGLTANNDGAVVGVDAVVTERHANTNSRLRINRNTYATGTTGSASPGGIAVGKGASGGGFANIRLFGLLMIEKVLSDAEILTVEAAMAGNCAAVLA